ncbi:uncharacterized protein N7503_002721 [Penicillium pulvis]|uniref:uncharacterized protein n=1 Tax=Penicillium pulvis TaxID=1562058 RepID=UPI002549635B|nr:uncharacterized protein N7503_002721 [Penicillium pulvis]KAJ5810503.1 hypothetical protein N7503_002721 [Penicillium pulvis]
MLGRASESASSKSKTARDIFKGLSETPSNEAVQAYTGYFQRDPHGCRYISLLKNMIHFLVDKSDIQIDPSALPSAVDEETVSEETVRLRVVNRLLEEFSEDFDDHYYHYMNPDTAEQLEEFEEGQYTKVVEVFYFCSNRIERQPSNLTRSAAIKTAKKIRGEKGQARHKKWDAEFNERRNHWQMDMAVSRAGTRESDTGNPAAIEHSLQKDVALEENAGGSYAKTEVLLPIPLDLISVDRTQVLTYLIQKVEELHSDRYASFLQHCSTVDICAKLEDILTPGVRRVSDDGPSSLKRLQSIGGDTESTAAGVYLHIIWLPEEPERFWLYVGQATDLARRIADHNNKIYRKKHLSLHYHIWDSREDTCSKSVVLATCDPSTKGQTVFRADQCCLNLLEMWMACLFQTLTARDLDKYLSPSISRSSAGRHLNVVPPIWQRFQDETVPERKEVFDRPSFQALLRSEDAAVRSWAQKARDSYNDIRNSPDPELRKYWLDNNKRQLQQAWSSNQQSTIARTKEYLKGKKTTVKCAPGRSRGFVTCGKFIISVPSSLEISPGSKLIEQFHLYQTAISHRFACKAMDYDPSSRLAISIKGLNASGNKVDTWLHSSGENKLAMRMNTLVDLLEDVPFNETCLLRRRWIVNRSETGIERQTEYTD